MLCTTGAGSGPIIHTRLLTLAPGQTAEAVLRAAGGVTALITRFLFAGSGQGPFGVAGVYLTQARIGNRYLTGGLTPGALTGAPTGEVALDALVRFFSRARLSAPVALSPGYDLVLTLKNTTVTAITVTVADDRDSEASTLSAGAKQAALLGHQPTLYALTAEVPAGADRHEIEIPHGAASGVISSFAVAASKENLVRFSVLMAGRYVVQDAYAALAEAIMAQGLQLPQPIRLGPNERLWIEASNPGANTEKLSFFTELVTPPLAQLPPGIDEPLPYQERVPVVAPLPQRAPMIDRSEDAYFGPVPTSMPLR